MGRPNKAHWIKWFDAQSPEDKRTMALSAIQRLIETEEIRFWTDDRVDKNGAPIPEETEWKNICIGNPAVKTCGFRFR